MSKVKFNYSKVNAASVDKLIATAVKSVQSMQKAVQYASVAVLLHSKAHGDYSKANDLVRALGQGVRGKALVEFFVQFGGLIVDTESPANGFNGWSGKDNVNVEAAKEQPWWELKPETPFKGFSLDVEIERLIKRTQKAQELAESDPDKAESVTVDVEKLVKLMGLMA